MHPIINDLKNWVTARIKLRTALSGTAALAASAAVGQLMGPLSVVTLVAALVTVIVLACVSGLAAAIDKKYGEDTVTQGAAP